MKIGIVGQFGFGNVGDEGILQAIMDSLGFEHEYVILTTLPFTMVSEYHREVPNAVDVRTIDDTRTDYDACIYGGGKVDWGFAWGFFLRAFAEGIPTMAYGIALRTDQTLKHSKLFPLFAQYFSNFDAITLRDIASTELLRPMSASLAHAETTMCPAINLKEERVECPEEATIAVCPRYGDFDENGEVNDKPQVDWFVEKIAELKAPQHEVLLIPFFHKDLENHPRDFALCEEINRRLGGGCHFLHTNDPRKIKYAISRSERVLSGGRYHAIVWAIAHGIPYDIAPTIGEPANSKIEGLVRMHDFFGREKLLEMEKENKRYFEMMFPW